MKHQIRTLLFGALVASAFAAAGPAAAQSYTFKTVNLPQFNTGPYRYMISITGANMVLAQGDQSFTAVACWIINTATGQSTLLTNPLADPLRTNCIAGNASGQVLGAYTTSTGNEFNFIYQNGVYKNFITVNGITNAAPLAISQSGIIVGGIIDSPAVTFIQNGSSYTTFTVPGLPYAGPTAVNNSGQIVILGLDGKGGEFSYLKTGASLRLISYPGSLYTEANAINNLGQVAGTYVDSTGNTRGFVYDSKTRAYRTIDAPNDAYTTLSGIDDQGTLIGATRANGADNYTLFQANKKP